MRKKRSIWIFPFILMGMLLMLTTSCKKDDDSNDNYYIFLVPDEGFSGISQLHDALYTDFMRTKLRLDIPFIPHIGIATHKDRDHLYALAQEWNAERHEIRGVIDSLSLCSYDDSKVDDIQTFQLGMRD